MSATADLERTLRGASLRVTRPRLAVLAAVLTHPHADTSTIISTPAQSSVTCLLRPSTTSCES